MPLNQSNKDLCINIISVLNRMPKIKNGKSPYGIFTEKKMDMKRDFQVDYWHEPIVEKNLKVTYLISSAGDLLL